MGDRLPRKLAAILYADVAGYSRLTGEDEEGTHRTLRAYLNLISSRIQAHEGRVVHYAGDAALADFGTVVDALTCATAIQRDLAERNTGVPDDRKVQFRIGVNLGDVIVDQGEIYGDGVNVAARLESLAEPGGICISDAVRTAVGKKLDLSYEDMGEQEVKNIEEPVRAYKVEMVAHKPDAVQPEPASTPSKGRQSQRPVVAAVVVLLVVVGGVLTWLRPWEPREEAVSLERMTFPLPDKPSIAVLPFTNMSDDPKQEYFVDGMTEDLITDLSKQSGLFVISRNSTFTYKGKPVKVRQVAEELGVRYVLEGSVRRVESQIRVNAQLIDATTGGHLWAERYDGSLENVFALQDDVTQRIVAALAVELTGEEVPKRGQRETASVDAYDAFLQGWVYYKLGTPADLIKAKPFLEEAVRLDPSYARAHAALASVYWDAFTNGWAFELGVLSFEAETLWEEHLELAMKAPNSLVHTVQSRVLTSQERYDEAAIEAKKAVALGF